MYLVLRSEFSVTWSAFTVFRY